jgi:hypothetical protein
MLVTRGLQRRFGGGVFAVFATFGFISGIANAQGINRGEAAQKALAEGYQKNYIGQRSLPDNATPAQRQAVSRAAFKDADTEIGKEMNRRSSQMAGTFAAMMKDFNSKMKEQRALRESLGLDSPGGDKHDKDKNDHNALSNALLEKLIKEGKLPPGTKRLPNLRELAKLMGKSAPKLGAAPGKPGAPGQGAAPGPGGKGGAPAATEVTGADGAKDVKFGKEKELQIKDGIIQDQ